MARSLVNGHLKRIKPGRTIHAVMGDKNYRQLPDLVSFVSTLGLKHLEISDVTPLQTDYDTGFVSVFDSTDFESDEISLVLSNAHQRAKETGIVLVPDEFFTQRVNNKLKKTTPRLKHATVLIHGKWFNSVLMGASGPAVLDIHHTHQLKRLTRSTIYFIRV